ncbi:MAG: calcium/proton exchanger [Cyanobium sp. NAT70]|nr:calcium/proton exchanger [Cyanobium sp. NAT70]|tara:strand:- start:4056 stop:5147 length:1092 start_codon:yes stop_codon:yes gene_type:complete
MASQSRILIVLTVLLPLSVLLHRFGASEEWIFISSIASIIPLAILLGTATERLAERLGPSIGALLTALFGNATELIIALIALRAGLTDIVKASITGSVMANLLLALGLSMLIGGLGRQEQGFSSVIPRVNGTAMTLAVLSILIPSLSGLSRVGTAVVREDSIHFSEFVAWILLIVYALTLLFSLKTHRSLYQPVAELNSGSNHQNQSTPPLIPWLCTLLVVTIAIAYESELFVGVVEVVTDRIGLSDVFTGVILLPLLGGTAEYFTAVSMARKNKMDLSVSVALSSTLLIALLVVPVLVLTGPMMGHPFDLNFGIYEVVAVIFAVVVSNLVSLDGRSDWLEGILLLAAYAILAAGFFFQITPV